MRTVRNITIGDTARLVLAGALALGIARLAGAQATASTASRGRAPSRSMLLLGLRSYDPRTVAIETIGDSVSIRSGFGLIVPRRSGFWRVGIGEPTADMAGYRGRVLAKQGLDSLLSDAAIDSLREAASNRAAEQSSASDTAPPVADTASSADDYAPTNMHGEPLHEGECFAELVWAAPSGSWPSGPPKFECEEDETWGGEASLSFVGPHHVSVYLGVTADVSYSFRRGSALGSLDSLAVRGLRSPDDSLGRAGWPPANARTKHEIRRCEIEYAQGMGRGADPEPDEYNGDYQGTIIERKPGRWAYARYYANTSYAGRGSEGMCDMRVPVPASVTGWDSLTVPWAKIKKQVPGAVDAFSSPRGDILVVATAQEVRVYRVRGATIGRLLGRATWQSSTGFEFGGGMQPGYVVMSQWAVGQGAERWSRELAPVLVRRAVVRR